MKVTLSTEDARMVEMTLRRLMALCPYDPSWCPSCDKLADLRTRIATEARL